jgi:hypothetical protein
MELQDRPAVVNGQHFYTIQSMLCAAKLVHHDLASHTDAVVHDPKNARAPWNAVSRLGKLLESRRIDPRGDAQWQMNLPSAVELVLKQFVRTDGSRIRNEFYRLKETYGKGVAFVYPSNASAPHPRRRGRAPCLKAPDMVMTCGIPSDQLPDDPDIDTTRTCPGNDLYGNMMGVVYYEFLHDKLNPEAEPRLDLDIPILYTPRFANPAQHKEAMGLIGDSTLKFFTEIHPSGRVITQGGVTSAALVDLLVQKGIEITDFRFVIFSIGTNDSTRHPKHWHGMLEKWCSHVATAMRRYPGLIVAVNSGVGYRHWQNLPNHTVILKDVIAQNLPENRVLFFDWSVPHGRNPFLFANGDPVLEFALEKENPRHLNYLGAALMHSEWRSRIPDLLALQVMLSDEPYKQPGGTLGDLPDVA